MVIRLILITIFISIGLMKSYSQSKDTLNLIDEDFTLNLPLLLNLIDSAITHNPGIKFSDLQLLNNQYSLKSEQSIWLKNIGLQGDVRYGTFNVFSTNTSEGQNPDVMATQENEFNYGVGAFIKFPVYDFVNRKNQMKLADIEIEQAKSTIESQKQVIRRMVITQYNDLILKFNVLKIKAKLLTLINANTVLIEKEFQNGQINISEYTRISGIQSNAESDYEKARIEFITCYMILEDIVGFKLNLGLGY